MFSGQGGAGVDLAGGRYDPATDRWRAMSLAGAPRPRSRAAVTWTDREMLVWGGADARNEPVGDGGRYDPAADRWRALATTGAPAARLTATAVWSGREARVWGGLAPVPGSVPLISMRFDLGGRYDPATDRWSETETLGAPSARNEHTALWSGTEMLIWGGTTAGGRVSSGGRFQP